jgi:hypothetical protein
MPEDGLPLKELGSVIPSVYYDLITRVRASKLYLCDQRKLKLSSVRR